VDVAALLFHAFICLSPNHALLAGRTTLGRFRVADTMWCWRVVVIGKNDGGQAKPPSQSASFLARTSSTDGRSNLCRERSPA